MPASPKKSQQKLEAGACGREVAGAGQMTLQEADDELRKFDLCVRFGYLTHDHPRFIESSILGSPSLCDNFLLSVCMQALPFPLPPRAMAKGSRARACSTRADRECAGHIS